MRWLPSLSRDLPAVSSKSVSFFLFSFGFDCIHTKREIVHFIFYDRGWHCCFLVRFALLGKGTGRITAPHAMSRVLMNHNLYENCSFHSTLFVVFLRFHPFEIGCLAIDESLDAGPVDRKPFHAVGIGDDEVEARLISSHVDAIGCGLVIVACQNGSPIGFAEWLPNRIRRMSNNCSGTRHPGFLL